MKKITLGIIFGSIAGIIDIIPMIFQKLSWDANISAFCLWLISGFLIATSNLKIKAWLKGLILSWLVLLPSAILIAWQEPFSLIPILIMTSILGPLLGYSIKKFGE